MGKRLIENEFSKLLPKIRVRQVIMSDKFMGIVLFILVNSRDLEPICQTWRFPSLWLPSLRAIVTHGR